MEQLAEDPYSDIDVPNEYKDIQKKYEIVDWLQISFDWPHANNSYHILIKALRGL